MRFLEERGGNPPLTLDPQKIAAAFRNLRAAAVSLPALLAVLDEPSALVEATLLELLEQGCLVGWCPESTPMFVLTPLGASILGLNLLDHPGTAYGLVGEDEERLWIDPVRAAQLRHDPVDPLTTDGDGAPLPTILLALSAPWKAAASPAASCPHHPEGPLAPNAVCLKCSRWGLDPQEAKEEE